MSLIYDFKLYRDQYGMNQLYTNGVMGFPSQNGELFTLEYVICLMESSTTSHEKKLEEIDRLKGVYKALEVLDGLTRRTPDSTEGNSMDNNGSSLIFSAMFGDREFAKRMKEHGEAVICEGPLSREDHEKWYVPASLVTILFTVGCRPWLWWRFAKNKFRPLNYWNNTEPEKFALWGWYGRSPGFLGLVDMCAQGYTSPGRWISLLVAQFIGVLFKDKDDLDQRKLPYTTWYFLTKKTGIMQRWFWRLMYKLWVKLLLRTYPNGMQDVYAGYYQDANHAIRKHSIPYFKV